jgi:hypothetical protein
MILRMPPSRLVNVPTHQFTPLLRRACSQPVAILANACRLAIRSTGHQRGAIAGKSETEIRELVKLVARQAPHWPWRKRAAKTHTNTMKSPPELVTQRAATDTNGAGFSHDRR